MAKEDKKAEGPAWKCRSFDDLAKCGKELQARILFHRGSFMIGDFCCGRFYQDSMETFETEDKAKKAFTSGSYERIGFIGWRYTCGPKTAVGLGLCTLVERPAPAWTGVEKNSMMIPLPEGTIMEFLASKEYDKCYLSEEEKIFLIDGYTVAQWDAAEAKAKAWLQEKTSFNED